VACWRGRGEGGAGVKHPERAGSRDERRFRSRDCARARRTMGEAGSHRKERVGGRRSGRERIKWMPGG